MTKTSTVARSAALIPDRGKPLDWDRGAGALASADSYWLATRGPEGHPHVMPVLAVWTDDSMHFCTSDSSRKGQNLHIDPSCVLTASSGGYDLVLEGEAERVSDDAMVRRAADTYDAKYGWRVAVRDGQFHDTEGAPSAGPPPYSVFAIRPKKAFAFGMDETTMSASTRWQFD